MSSFDFSFDLTFFSVVRWAGSALWRFPGWTTILVRGPYLFVVLPHEGIKSKWIVKLRTFCFPFAKSFCLLSENLSGVGVPLMEETHRVLGNDQPGEHSQINTTLANRLWTPPGVASPIWATDETIWTIKESLVRKLPSYGGLSWLAFSPHHHVNQPSSSSRDV
jgi:hypothetical protein